VRRLALVILAAAAVAVAIVAPASGDRAAGHARATRVVQVADDFYGPASVKINKNSKVKWVWQAYNFNTHNVSLTGDVPKGVKKSDFKSASATTNFSYTKKFKVPGRYQFICTFHRSVMKMSVKVKR
jgi:plastocyanin